MSRTSWIIVLAIVVGLLSLVVGPAQASCHAMASAQEPRSVKSGGSASVGRRGVSGLISSTKGAGLPAVEVKQPTTGTTGSGTTGGQTTSGGTSSSLGKISFGSASGSVVLTGTPIINSDGSRDGTLATIAGGGLNSSTGTWDNGSSGRYLSPVSPGSVTATGGTIHFDADSGSTFVLSGGEASEITSGPVTIMFKNATGYLTGASGTIKGGADVTAGATKVWIPPAKGSPDSNQVYNTDK